MFDKMKIDATVKIEYKDLKDAEISFKSLENENNGHIDSYIEKNELNFQLSYNSLSTFLSTIDDLIFSEILIEKILESAPKR